MTTQEAKDFFNGDIMELAKFLGVWPQTIYQWGKTPPMGRQYELEVKTNGALKASEPKKHG